MKNFYLSRLFAVMVLLGMSLTLTTGQTFEVTAPASVAGTYDFGTAVFGPQFDGFSGELVSATDVDGLTTGCVAIDNGVTDVTGKVALIDRGACGFTVKALNAQAAGASAVIICNNDAANPDAVITLGGDDMCMVTIPTIMLSLNDCATLRMETGVMATYTAPDLPGVGESFDTAIPITDGTYTVDSITGAGGIFSGSVGAAFYLYTPAADGVLNINSCGGGANTRLIFGQAGCVGQVGGGLIGFSIDDCDDGNGNIVASDLDVLVFEGETYYILWDDAQSADGFDFTVTLGALPTVNTTFTVNMEEETVSPDGVNMVWAAPGTSDVGDVNIAVMTDNGDGTWSATIELTTLDTIGYAFVNGMVDPANVEAVPDDCGVLNDFGFNVRPYIEFNIGDSSVPPVCFGLCTNCPTVAVTFSVNMANEDTSPDGVNMVWGGPGTDDVGQVNIVALSDDDGDDVWEASVNLMTGDTIGYAFVNGMLAVENVEAVPDDCGLENAFGFNIRPLIVEGADDIVLDAVCFGTCLSFCPEEGCEAPATVMENMDNYELGSDVTTQSDIWVLWPAAGVIGGEVSDEQAASPPHSVKLQGGGDTGTNDLVDPLLNLGGVSSGAWDIRFKMYVPEGGSGYYNIQNNEGADPTQWNVEVGFEADGTLGVDLAGAGEYPQGEWFDIVNIIDVDNERGEIIINGQSVYTWTYGPDWSIGAFNFFPRTATELYYIDDVIMRPILLNGESCPEGSIICDGLESYNDGPVSDQSSHWAPWTASPADDGIVTEEQAFEGCNSLKITADDPDDQLLLLGDRTEGNYLLEWFMYIPDGSAGYYNFQKFQDDPGGEFAHQVEFFTDGTATLDAGAADIVTWNWTPDTWMRIQHFIDLDNDWMTYVIDGDTIYQYPVSWGTFMESGAKQIGSIDFFGNTDVIQYIDNVLFQQLPSLPGNLCAGAVDINSNLGAPEGETISTGPYNNVDYFTTSQDPDFGWECFGEPDDLGGAPSLERTRWFTFTGDGGTYFIEAVACGDDPIDFGDTQMVIYSGDCGNLETVLCVDDGPNAMAGGPFPAGDTLATESGTVYYVMIDGFGPDFPSDGDFCMEFTTLTAPTVEVTFQVDMMLTMVDPGGVFIAGSFSDFQNVPMEDPDANGIFTVTLELAVGSSHTYKFKNGPDGWETIDTSIGDNCTTGDFGDRFIDVGMDNETLDVVCFNYCVDCATVDVDEVLLSQGFELFPNPATEQLQLRFDFGEVVPNLNLRVVNPLGQTVTERYLGNVMADQLSLDVSNFPAGIYLIELASGKERITRTVVVE